jgi:hypothetical protein
MIKINILTRHKIKMTGYCVLIFSLGIFLVLCQKDKEFTGYKDLLYNLPALLWGSSIEEVKSKYPNIEKNGFGGYDDNRNNLTGQIQSRMFFFYDNQLYKALINYGTYNDNELDLLRKNIQKKYGIFLIEDNGTIEFWDIADNENNVTVFTINKLENNTVRGSYINPKLMDEADKNVIME